ncbi:MAG: hypothetical protein ABH804_00040 [archaeon]
MKINLSEEQMKNLIQLANEYKFKSEFKKIKNETDFVKIGRNYILIIKPFLIFASFKDEMFKEFFKKIIDNEELNTLPDELNVFDKPEVSNYTKGETRERITGIVSKNLKTFEELNSLILVLESEFKENVDNTNY